MVGCLKLLIAAGCIIRRAMARSVILYTQQDTSRENDFRLSPNDAIELLQKSASRDKSAVNKSSSFGALLTENSVK